METSALNTLIPYFKWDKRMEEENRVEKEFEDPDAEDMFDETFGPDAEKQAAKAKMKERIEEKRERLEKEKKKRKKEAGQVGRDDDDIPGPPMPDEPEEPEQSAAEMSEVGVEPAEEPKKAKKKAVKAKKEPKPKPETKPEEEVEQEDEEKDELEPEEPEEPDEPEPEQPKMPKETVKEKIRKIVVAKAKDAAEKQELPFDREIGTKEVGVKEKNPTVEKKPPIKPELKFLQDTEDENKVYIGRKSSVYKKYGAEASLFVGKVNEDTLRGKNIYLDSLNPHVVFVCGARGSGKSYVLGVMAEELSLKNKNVGVIVVDPIGVFWSMRFPNREQRELELLGKWELEPQGLDNLKVFIPQGMKDKVPRKTYDDTFSLPPSMLSPEDWCLTFGIERFSPSGLLLEKALGKVARGYKTKEGKFVKPKGKLFSLDDIVFCLINDVELNSAEKGYKHDSIRALTSRFDAAKNWGVFDKRGTPLSELSSENQLTIIDTSFLEDNVSALVIGILARRVLAARKLSTRKEAANRMKETSTSSLLEEDIPPTWIFIDEAHTLIPSGNVKTPASTPIIEYVKQGRQPGCSLVFATQQPSAIDTKVLSQLDVIISHKLVFDDDIKAIYKRTPTIIPKRYKNSNFVKTLPVGVGLTGDRREETSRAFVMRIRPRMSQHEGREAETVERSIKLGNEEVLKLASGLMYAKVERAGKLETTIVNDSLKSLNIKYKSNLQLGELIEELEKKGVLLDTRTSTLSLPQEENEESIIDEISGEPEIEIARESKAILPDPEPVELLAFPVNLSEEAARKAMNKARKKKFLGLIGIEETIEKITLKHLPVYRIKFNMFNSHNMFHTGEVFFDSGTGEFLHFNQKTKRFMESRGLQVINDLKENEIRALFLLKKEKRDFEALVKAMAESEMISKKALESLVAKGLAAKEKTAGQNFYSLNKELDLPRNLLHPLLRSLETLPVSKAEALSLEMERYPKQRAIDVLQKLGKKIVVKSVTDVYLPFYETILKMPDGKLRAIRIEAVRGSPIHVHH